MIAEKRKLFCLFCREYNEFASSVSEKSNKTKAVQQRGLGL